MAVRIGEHPQLRSRLVDRARRKYQTHAVRRPQSLLDGAPARSLQFSFFPGRSVDSHKAGFFRYGDEFRAVRRPGWRAFAIFLRRSPRPQLAFRAAVYVRQNQRMRAARGVSPNESQLPAVGRDAETAPDILRDLFPRAAESRCLIYRSRVRLVAEVQVLTVRRES